MYKQGNQANSITYTTAYTYTKAYNIETILAWAQYTHVLHTMYYPATLYADLFLAVDLELH